MNDGGTEGEQGDGGCGVALSGGIRAGAGLSDGKGAVWVLRRDGLVLEGMYEHPEERDEAHRELDRHRRYYEGKYSLTLMSEEDVDAMLGVLEREVVNGDIDRLRAFRDGGRH
jgi:hypothetical protein